MEEQEVVRAVRTEAGGEAGDRGARRAGPRWSRWALGGAAGTTCVCTGAGEWGWCSRGPGPPGSGPGPRPGCSVSPPLLASCCSKRHSEAFQLIVSWMSRGAVTRLTHPGKVRAVCIYMARLRRPWPEQFRRRPWVKVTRRTVTQGTMSLCSLSPLYPLGCQGALMTSGPNVQDWALLAPVTPGPLRALVLCIPESRKTR